MAFKNVEERRRYHRDYYNKRKQRGICVCGKESTIGHVLCASCLYKRNQYKHQHMALGLCCYCNKPRLAGTKRCCVEHYYWYVLYQQQYRTKHPLYHKQYYIKHLLSRKESVRQRSERLQGEGKCRNCAIPLIEGEGVFCVNCRIVIDNQISIKGVLKYATAD